MQDKVYTEIIACITAFVWESPMTQNLKLPKINFNKRKNRE